MLNKSILTALMTYTDSDDLQPESLKDLRAESQNLCESIEYGLMHLGEMMTVLGNLADEKEQNFTHEAMSNDNVKHIGGLIKANAYLLNCLRETTAQATFNINGGLELQGAK